MARTRAKQLLIVTAVFSFPVLEVAGQVLPHDLRPDVLKNDTEMAQSKDRNVSLSVYVNEKEYAAVVKENAGSGVVIYKKPTQTGPVSIRPYIRHLSFLGDNRQTIDTIDIVDKWKGSTDYDEARV